jgi:hypothetical protein
VPEVQLQPARHWEADVHAVVVVCMHVPSGQQRHEPPSQMLGKDGQPASAGHDGMGGF